MLISFLFLSENICCGYSLEAPRWGASNEYPQHMFLSRNKENIMWIPPLICSYAISQCICLIHCPHAGLGGSVGCPSNRRPGGHGFNPRRGLGGSVGCAVWLETRRSQVQPLLKLAAFFCGGWSWNNFYSLSLPSADPRRTVVIFWRKNLHNTG